MTMIAAGGIPGPAGATGAAGAAGAAGPQNLAASILAANATNSTVTMAATGLSVNVTTGHRYAFRAILMLSDSSTGGASGAKFDFDGGSATSTDFRCWADDSAIGAFPAQFSTSKSTDIESGGPFTTDRLVLEGSFEPSSTGTFAIRFAQVTVVDGAITLFRGSSLTLWEP